MSVIQESQMFVEFFTEAIELKHESLKQGRPIFKDVPWIKILNPGDNMVVIERPATNRDKEKYPNAWQRYDSAGKGEAVGTPLDKWPQITRSMLREAQHFHVNTVEQLAGISDANVNKMGMGFQDLRAKAKAYLAAAEGGVPSKAQDEKIAEMERQLEEMRALLEAQTEPEKRGPGRPRKEAVEA